MSVRRRVSEADGAAAFAQVRQVFASALSGEKPLIIAENRADIEQAFTRLPRGVRATAGTPPSVVETSGFIWCALAAGALTWDDASASGLLTASGERSNLSRYFPLF